MISVHKFQVPVRCRVPFENRFEEYEDSGILLLPEGYSESGAPVRLVVSCHGAGGTVTTDDAQICSQTVTKYLLANGFAVMDMAGLPMAYCDRYGVDSRNNIGGPIAMASYRAGYLKCISGFHLKREVLLHGASMGGITSANLVLNGVLPVLVHTCFCPVLDTYEEIYLHPWSGGLPRTALEKMYGLSGECYEPSKIGPYNPMTRVEASGYPVPLEIWQCANDETVSVAVTARFAERVRSLGGSARLHVLPSGGHEPQDYGGPVAEPAGITVWQGENLFITPAVEGVLRTFLPLR